MMGRLEQGVSEISAEEMGVVSQQAADLLAEIQGKLEMVCSSNT